MKMMVSNYQEFIFSKKAPGTFASNNRKRCVLKACSRINSFKFPYEELLGQVINSAFEKIVESKSENMEIHIFYAGFEYGKLHSYILKEMEKYEIENVMVTIINIQRWQLITNEKVLYYCKGQDEVEEESVNDDLEYLFEEIKLGCKYFDEVSATYFLPKLTKEELELVERKDENFMQTFVYKMAADVDKTEMEASESDSKFIYGSGRRRTFTIEKSENH